MKVSKLSLGYLVLIISQALYAEPQTPQIEGCYQLKQAGLLNNIKIELTSTEESERYLANLRVGGFYSAYASCSPNRESQNEFRCQVECDGGSADMIVHEAGLTLENNNMSLNSMFRIKCNTKKMSELTGKSSELNRVVCRRIINGSLIKSIADFASELEKELKPSRHHGYNLSGIQQMLSEIRVPTRIEWANSQDSQKLLGPDYEAIINLIKEAQESLPKGRLTIDLFL